MPFRSEKQRRYLWANEPKIAREWTDEYGSKPVKAKKGKYQEFKHPQHDILPLEHMEEKVSSKERVEKLLDERKSKKESKKKLVKDGHHYVPGWRPNLSVKAAEGELVRQKTQGTGAAIKGIEHYTMKGMPTAQTGQLIQTPTRGTGAAVKGTDHYVMQGMDAAKTGKMIKAKKGKRIGMRTEAGKIADKRQRLYEQAHGEFFTAGLFGRKKSDASTGGGAPPPLRLLTGMKNYWQGKPDSLKQLRKFNKENPPPKDSKYQLKTGGPIKAKKGIFHSTATSMYDKPPGWDVKKISDKTHKKLTKVWKHRETGGWKSKAGKEYRKYLKDLKKVTTKTLPAIKSKSFYFSDVPKPSQLSKSSKALAVLKAVGKRTGIGKAVVAATAAVAGYKTIKHQLKKQKDNVKKKSIGGETVVMKSGGGYIDELL